MELGVGIGLSFCHLVIYKNLPKLLKLSFYSYYQTSKLQGLHQYMIIYGNCTGSNDMAKKGFYYFLLIFLWELFIKTVDWCAGFSLHTQKGKVIFVISDLSGSKNQQHLIHK